MKCNKCIKEFKEKFIERHHLLPYAIFKTYNCEEIFLCKWCHKRLHTQLETLGYSTKEKILEFTDKWLKGETIIKEREEFFPFCPICKDSDKRLTHLSTGSNFIILHCSYCGYESEKIYGHLFNLWINKKTREDYIEGKKFFAYKDELLEKEDKNDSFSKI